MPGHRGRRVLVAATVTEGRCLLKFWKPTLAGTWEREARYLIWKSSGEDLPFSLIVTGIGPSMSRAGLEQALTDIGNVGAVVGFGFAGGLVKSGKRGDLVIPTRIRWGQTTQAPTEWLRMSLASHSDTQAWRDLITVDQVISSPAEKAALFAATGAEGVDMESGAWGSVCQGKKVPWAIVRAILDPSDQALPRELSKTLDVFGEVRWGKSLSLFLSHPALIQSALEFRGSVLEKAAQPMMKLLSAWLEAVS